MSTARPDVIELSPGDKVDEGGERVVFVHPDDPTRLIKVIKPRYKEEFYRWTFGHLSQRYIPSARWRPTVKQYHEYQRLMLNRQYDVDFQLPIAHLYGFVKTTLGLGCITERVTAPDGSNGPTLAKLADRGLITQDRLDEVNAFIKTLYDISICVGDVGPKNFVYGNRHIGPKSAVSAPSWVLVDGFGDKFAITIRTYSRTVRSLGIDDEFKRRAPPKGLIWLRKERRYAFAD